MSESRIENLTSPMNEKEKLGCIGPTWLNWCCLCAKREEADQENSLVFVKNESGKFDSELKTAIETYFRVNFKAEDEISIKMCVECRKFIEELLCFTERVNKVQNMYVLFQNLKITSLSHANKLRSQCGFIDEGWEHIVKPTKPKEVEISKPQLKEQETQTDFMIYLNSGLREEKKIDIFEYTKLRKEIVEDLEKQDDGNDHLRTKVVDSEQTYDFDLRDDDELEFLKNTEMELQVSKPNIIDASVVEQGVDVREVVQDTDSGLFKELKLKIEDDDDHRVGIKFELSSDQDGIELEYQQSSETLSTQDFDDMKEEALEEIDNDEDDEDYVNIGELSKNQESVNRYECKECKRKYKNPNMYRKHMQSKKHNEIIEKLPEKLAVPCPHCDRKFTQIANLKRHEKVIHHKMRPFICDHCGKACPTNFALKVHQLVHTTECPFECDVCHKRFKRKHNLQSHMDVHTKSVYTCTDCGFELKSKRTLRDHMLVHSDVKRFKCEFCDAEFKRAKTFKDHIILHVGLLPYKCNFCERSFSTCSNCRSHKKRAHPTEFAEEEAKGIVSEPVALPKLEVLKSVLRSFTATS